MANLWMAYFDVDGVFGSILYRFGDDVDDDVVGCGCVSSSLAAAASVLDSELLFSPASIVCLRYVFDFVFVFYLKFHLFL